MAEISSGDVPAKAGHRQEATFKNYTASDAAKYATYRLAYNPLLIELVVQNHTSTGGGLNQVLDIGCGPGIATRQIAAYFQHVVGIDAGASMIEQAQKTDCFSASGEQAVFKICNAESIDQSFEPASIDLITIATAAHWFDMPRFYAAASKVLKPSGSIAMWGGGGWYVDPETPNKENVQHIWTEFEVEVLKPFEEPGNKLARELYKDLEMPWTIDLSLPEITPEMANELKSYDESSSIRREFNKDGIPDPSPEFADTHGFMTWRKNLSLEVAGKMLGTASQVTRWRQAYKEQLEKGEIEDCLDKMLRLTREELAKTPEGVGKDCFDVGIAMVLIVVKKKP